MKIYTNVTISPHHAGFGMYDRGELQSSPQNSWSYLSDLIDHIRGNAEKVLPIDEALADPDFVELGVGDIRGYIYNEPTHIYVVIDDYSTLVYIGIEESEVADDFFLTS